MNPSLDQATEASIGHTSSPDFIHEYHSAPAGQDDDFIMSLGQQTSGREKGRLALTTILLAEDNDDLRDVMEMFLGMMDYSVVPCCDGQVASAMFRSNAHIDVLISDLEMPGKSGLELARELTSLRPSLPVMIVSGAEISSDMALEMKYRNWKFLPKPCGLPLILATLQSLLHSDVFQAA